MAIAWERGGYEVDSWRVFRVDPRTWADGEMVGCISSLSVARNFGKSDRTIERGELLVDLPAMLSFEEGYYRFAETVRQNGAMERVDVATLLCMGTSDKVSRNVSAAKVIGHSVLYPASRTTLQIGSYAPAKVNGAQWVADRLRETINAPVIVIGDGFTLDDHVVFKDETKVLDGSWLVLEAGNHIIQINGRGEVLILAKPQIPSLDLDLAHARLLMPEVERELDWSEVINKYVAIDGDSVAVAVNDDPSSPTSVAKRGWVSDKYDTSPVKVNGETLSAYCERRLEEESMVEDARSYTREWWPDVLPGDIVRGSIASIGMVGDFRVKSQQITCGKGITVQERAAREVYAWTRS